MYLSTIMDAFNRQIISYVVSNRSLAMKIVKQAMRGRKVKDVILYTDQGSVYTAKEFQSYAKQNGIITSISRKGNFYSQKIARVFNTAVRKVVLKYIHYYNCVRIQEKSNHLSPKEFREQMV